MKIIVRDYLGNEMHFYEYLIGLYNQVIYSCDKNIVLDFSNTKRVAGNLISIFT